MVNILGVMVLAIRDDGRETLSRIGRDICLDGTGNTMVIVVKGLWKYLERRGKEIYQDVFVLLVSNHHIEELQGMEDGDQCSIIMDIALLLLPKRSVKRTL